MGLSGIVCENELFSSATRKIRKRYEKGRDRRTTVKGQKKNNLYEKVQDGAGAERERVKYTNLISIYVGRKKAA